jgi:hypothetical protein
MAKADFTVGQDEGHFAGHGILIKGHRHAAEHLRRAHRPIKPRPVVADDRQVVAALEAEFGQAAGHGAHFLRHLAPGPGLPDAQVFLPGCRTVAAHRRMIQQQTGKCIERARSPPRLGCSHAFFLLQRHCCGIACLATCPLWR